MPTNDKTRTEAPRNRPGLVGRGFQPRHNDRRGAPSARGAFPASLHFPAFRFNPSTTGPSSPPPRRLFAFSSPKTPKAAADHPSIAAERHASQVIEKNQSRYALSVNFSSPGNARFSVPLIGDFFHWQER
jgi:hypothetical protein